MSDENENTTTDAQNKDNPLKTDNVEDRANPLSAAAEIEDRANPLSAARVEDRANPLSAARVEDRANPLSAARVEKIAPTRCRLLA